MLTDKSYQNKMNNDKNLFFSELRCELRIIYFLKLHPFLRHYCTKHVDPKPDYNCPVFYVLVVFDLRILSTYRGC